MAASSKVQHGVSSSEHQRRWEQGARQLSELDPELLQWMQRVSRRAGIAVVLLLSAAAAVGISVVGSVVR